MGKHPSIGVILILAACQLAVAQEAALTTTITPSEIRPGDVFRLEVTRSSTQYAGFQLDMPVVNRLYLIATEQSPVEYVAGRYVQSESWIFQADASGDITIDQARVTLSSGEGEKQVALPPMKITVLPYPQADTDPVPLDWDAPEEESSGLRRNLIYLTSVLLTAALLVAASRRKRKKSAAEHAEPDLLGEALVDLDAGHLNADSLHRLYADRADGLPDELKSAIEQAIYAKRGNAGKLAQALRRELAS